jgi:biotin transport system substrate-specific component
MQKLLSIAIATLLICLLAPIGFRVDGILLTLQTLVIFMVAGTLGKNTALLATLLYLLIGALGAPVFGGYSGGWERLIGSTAGFLWGFPLCAWLLGWLCEKQEVNFLNYIKNFGLMHFVLIAIGFVVLKLMEPSVLLFETFQGLIPGLLIKSIVGGLLSMFLRQKFPHWHEAHSAA